MPDVTAALRDLRQHIVFDPEGDLTRAEFDAMLARADAAIREMGADTRDAARYRALRDVFSRPHYFSSDTGNNLDELADKLVGTAGVAPIDGGE